MENSHDTIPDTHKCPSGNQRMRRCFKEEIKISLKGFPPSTSKKVMVYLESVDNFNEISSFKSGFDEPMLKLFQHSVSILFQLNKEAELFPELEDVLSKIIEQRSSIAYKMLLKKISV